MKFIKAAAMAYMPDGVTTEIGLARTTRMCIAAHQDDIELMCYHGISECFGKADEWFSGIVVTDGAGSPRNGIYGDFTDEQMKAVRVIEQNKAAFVGDYSACLQLAYSSKEVKGECDACVKELSEIIKLAKPKIIYTHNPADKHDTHMGVLSKVIKAIRLLKKADRPQIVYGCEVWRDLDWVNDDEKVIFDVSARPNIAAALVGVFDSQICGGKRYDLAAIGRRTANATYSASHGCDTSTALSYALDLTPLIQDDSLTAEEFIVKFIESFKADVTSRIKKIF